MDVLRLASLLDELPPERTRLLDNLGRIRREVGPITPELSGRARRPDEPAPRRRARGRLVLLVPAGAGRRGARLHRTGLRLRRVAQPAHGARSRSHASATATWRRWCCTATTSSAASRTPTNGFLLEPDDLRDAGEPDPGRSARAPRGLRPDRHGWRGLPHLAQVGRRAERARPARRDRQRRRGRAGDDQGPLRDGAAPAAPARRARRRRCASARPTRPTSTCARSTRTSRARAAGGDRGARASRSSSSIGAGAYICGEETAMLESMEGRRGMPRLQPPFPASPATLGRPTLINNVETLAHVALILRGGWQPARLWSVTGAVAKPGCYEAPLDVTLRSLIDELRRRPDRRAEARSCPAALRAAILPPAALDVPLTREALAEWGCGVGSAARAGLPEPRTPRSACSRRRCASSPRSRARSAPRAGSATAPSTTSARSSSTGARRCRGTRSTSGWRRWRVTSICGLGQARADPGPERLRTLARAVREDARMIEFTLDGQTGRRAGDGELLVHAAARNGVFIPTLCHDDKLEPYGGCRMCVVGVEGAPRPLPACATRVTDGMVVSTNSNVPQLRKTLTEMLLSEHLNDESGRAAERAHRPRRGAGRGGAARSSPTPSGSRTTTATG